MRRPRTSTGAISYTLWGTYWKRNPAWKEGLKARCEHVSTEADTITTPQRLAEPNWRELGDTWMRWVAWTGVFLTSRKSYSSEKWKTYRVLIVLQVIMAVAKALKPSLINQGLVMPANLALCQILPKSWLLSSLVRIRPTFEVLKPYPHWADAGIEGIWVPPTGV